MRIIRSSPLLWFTAPIAILLAISAGSGVFVHDLYNGSPASVVVQAVAQDYISLLLVLPTLIITALLASRDHGLAHLIWLGAVAYLIYSYITYTFVVAFNILFLVYVGLLGCSLYALIAGFAGIQKAGIQIYAAEKTPAKIISIVLVILAGIFYLLWLSEVIPALVDGSIPQSAIEVGTPTNIVHVLDMAWILPAFIISAVSLWRKQAMGYMLAGTLLSFFVLLISAVLSMAVFDVLGGNPESIPQVVMFGTLFAFSLGILAWFLKNLNSQTTGWHILSKQ